MDTTRQRQGRRRHFSDAFKRRVVEETPEGHESVSVVARRNDLNSNLLFTCDLTPPGVWFRYSPDRKGLHPQQHLKPFRGTLQADAFAGFNPLYGERVVEAGCWAHVRRKFYDLTQAGPAPAADEALQHIGRLYAIEAEIRGQPPDRRRAVRQARAGAGRAQGLAAGDAGEGLDEVGARRGDQVCARTLGGAGALCR